LEKSKSQKTFGVWLMEISLDVAKISEKSYNLLEISLESLAALGAGLNGNFQKNRL
jgi:hypothetical protein